MAVSQPLNTKQKIGKKWEQDFAAAIGGEVVPGSGNQWWAKLDVGSHAFLWSLKATAAKSFRLSLDDVYEAVRGVIGPGGKGGKTLPGIALRIDDEELIVLRMSDFFSIMQEDVKFIPLSKKQEKQAQASVPTFQRTDHKE